MKTSGFYDYRDGLKRGNLLLSAESLHRTNAKQNTKTKQQPPPKSYGNYEGKQQSQLFSNVGFVELISPFFPDFCTEYGKSFA